MQQLSASVNSLWYSDAICRHSSASILVQVMVCCPTAPRHYRNQCWFVIIKVLWHSSDGSFTGYPSHQELKLAWNYLSEVSLKSSRGQWVKPDTQASHEKPFCFSWRTHQQTHLTNRPISQCIHPAMHHFVTEMCTRAHFCYKMVHCGLWNWYIMGFVQHVYSLHKAGGLGVELSYHRSGNDSQHVIVKLLPEQILTYCQSNL